PYNIFYNPAYVNDYKNWATIEKSNSPGNTAQGGFINSFLNFNFGLYLNRVDGVARLNSTASSDTYSNYTNMRPVDIFLGADMGVKWGLSLTTASYTIGNQTQSDLTGKLGVIV